jgi:hypothetical protein
VNLEVAWDTQGNTGVPTTRIPVYVCASEVNDRVRLNAGVPYVYPQTYGFNFGTWFVYDPATGQAGDGVFFPNSRLTHAGITDGHSTTLMATEVRAYTVYFRNTADPGPVPPASPADVQALTAGGQFRDTGHTEWPDGRVHHSGITTVFTPNTTVPIVNAGTTYDGDYNSRQEGNSATLRTYAAITARSYHSGGIVNVALMDGSIRPVTDKIDLLIWRALGTRAGSEIATDF